MSDDLIQRITGGLKQSNPDRIIFINRLTTGQFGEDWAETLAGNIETLDLVFGLAMSGDPEREHGGAILLSALFKNGTADSLAARDDFLPTAQKLAREGGKIAKLIGQQLSDAYTAKARAARARPDRAAQGTQSGKLPEPS